MDVNKNKFHIRKEVCPSADIITYISKQQASSDLSANRVLNVILLKNLQFLIFFDDNSYALYNSSINSSLIFNDKLPGRVFKAIAINCEILIVLVIETKSLFELNLKTRNYKEIYSLVNKNYTHHSAKEKQRIFLSSLGVGSEERGSFYLRQQLTEERRERFVYFCRVYGGEDKEENGSKANVENYQTYHYKTLIREYSTKEYIFMKLDDKDSIVRFQQNPEQNGRFRFTEINLQNEQTIDHSYVYSGFILYSTVIDIKKVDCSQRFSNKSNSNNNRNTIGIKRQNLGDDMEFSPFNNSNKVAADENKKKESAQHQFIILLNSKDGKNQLLRANSYGEVTSVYSSQQILRECLFISTVGKMGSSGSGGNFQNSTLLPLSSESNLLVGLFVFMSTKTFGYDQVKLINLSSGEGTKGLQTDKNSGSLQYSQSQQQKGGNIGLKKQKRVIDTTELKTEIFMTMSPCRTFVINRKQEFLKKGNMKDKENSKYQMECLHLVPKKCHYLLMLEKQQISCRFGVGFCEEIVSMLMM